jgi:conjugative relaxase-like TrwC/TraI family protein
MLSIAKIGSASSQAASSGDYANYLGAAKPAPDHAAYLEYAGAHDIDAPAPFWACKGPELLGLDAGAEAEHIERLARGFHPLTGEPLVKGAGDKHVMGLDMTFSAPKDFSAVFAGADAATRSALVECLQGAARDALAYAEQAAVTRHGHAGLDKQFAEAAVAFCATHMASRALQPQLHVHAMFLNVGKRRGADEWSALEHRPQFDRKMATGALFRVALADRVRALGFGIVPDGPYFAIEGITQEQRDALSMRSQEIDQLLREAGLEGAGPKARQAAALATRSRKAEPPLPELLESFERQAEAIGITPDAVSRMRSMGRLQSEFAIDREALLRDLVASQSCATSQEALSLICERAMGRLSAAECLAELDAFMAHENVVHLGRTEALSAVFTSRATLDMEAAIDRRFEAGKADRSHSVDPALIDREFDRLESELRAKLGVEVSLSQQRAAARHIACAPGSGALVVGWAGTGKTTMLRAAAAAMRGSGLEVVGCCQSAAAAQNLAREAGIPSRTIASLMLSIRQDRARLGPRSLVVLDEAGMVGSREFSDLQEAILAAGGKLVCVGDPKQLQPIEAGGVFASLIRIHGAAEISSIQRQRTDFEPLLKWLESRQARVGGIDKAKADALRGMPEEARLDALEALCAREPKLARGFERWKSRYDFEWMREAVEKLATGHATEALELMDSKGRVKLSHGRDEAFDELISAWAADKTPLPRKAIVAGTRADVAELNARARAVLIERGVVDDAKGVEVEITHRDESKAMRRFAPGDRVVFTKNDRNLGVANGVSGTVAAIEARIFETLLVVELDDANERGETSVRIPASFGRLDHALCLTNHKSQGRTYDSAHVMAGMLDREWAYVACSRSRFATTLYADASSLGLVDLESHRSSELAPKSRADALDALASRMRRSRAKGTTLDYDDAPDIRPEQELHGSDISRPAPALGARMVSAARRLMASLAAKRAMAVERGHGSGGARQGGLETEREQEQERAR